jgi:non-reducing end alpha-L-arabinofuranosidase
MTHLRNLAGMASAIAGLSLWLAAVGCSSTASGEGGGGSIGSGGKSGSGGIPGSGGKGGSAAGGAGGAGGNSSGGGSGKSTGGSGGVAQGGASGAGGTCPAATPCGGDLLGDWTVTSSCLKVSGQLDLSLAGTGCDSAPITGARQVTGTFTATSDGKYVDNTVTSGDDQFALVPSCLVISSTPVNCSGAANLLTAVLGYAKLECASNAGGGCDCSGHIQQSGGLGLLAMDPSTAGKYRASGNTFTLIGSASADDTQYDYCVKDGTLTVAPKSGSPVVAGSITFHKGGLPGSGGASGSGGQTGSGGARATGGAGGTTGQGGSGGARATGGTVGSTGGATGAGGSTVGGTGPCDIYGAANTPCVAAHSVVRALYGGYDKPLYQVRRTDNTTKDILPLVPGGIADTGPEDTFCAGSTCVLTVVYDQSGKGNDLWYQGSEQVPASKSSSAAKATADPVTVAGHKVYSLYISPGNCYWHDGSKSGMATGSQPEGMYMVTSARHTNSGCCFDYGNSETTRSADVGGAMDAINISSITAWGTGAGSGPWIMADLEWGVFAQGDNKNNPNDPTQTAPFVTAVMKNNGTTEYAIKGADATSGNLSTYYKGSVPWNPMKKQGALILGCGGDCCKPSGGANASSGIFFEGAIVVGYPTDAAESAVQANIVAAGYGK